MKPLGLTFRLDELSAEGRAFKGELATETLSDALSGMVGDLGYRCPKPAVIEGMVYRSSGAEVIVDGRLTTEVGFDCVRCLASRLFPVDLRKDLVLVKRKPASATQEVTLDDSDLDDDIESFEGDEIDISDLFRQELLIELPMNPSCAHLEGVTCVEIEQSEEAEEAQIDPRWAKLLEMRKKMN